MLAFLSGSALAAGRTLINARPERPTNHPEHIGTAQLTAKPRANARNRLKGNFRTGRVLAFLSGSALAAGRTLINARRERPTNHPDHIGTAQLAAKPGPSA